MKKIISAIIASLLLLTPSFAQGSENKNWYFVSKDNNERPGLPQLSENAGVGIGKDEKVIYLTFDAGYENGNVKKIVDIMKENEVTGAFFVLKHFVEANPELIKEIKNNHNLVCNHTSSHKSITSLCASELEEELKTLEKAYFDATGFEMDRYFRPPEGTYSDSSLEVISSLGYKTVFWSLAYADWDNDNQKSKEYALNKLYKRVHNGAVILLHPTSRTNTEILDEFIKTMKDKGYRFGGLEEL